MRIIPPKAEAIAYHGWAFDRYCWHPWQDRFAEQGIPLRAFDRGYFGAPTQPTFEYPSSQKIILAHSYGLHLCPSQQLRAADLIIVFGGFQRFHPPNRPGYSQAERRSRRVLQQMIRQLDRVPEQVLEAFWQNCGLPPEHWPNASARVLQPLAHDLRDLDHSLLCVEFLARRPKVLILHGREDAIAPLSQGQDLAQALFNNAEWFALDGPHALPFTQVDACWNAIGAFIQFG